MAEFTLHRYPLIQGYERIEEFTGKILDNGLNHFGNN